MPSAKKGKISKEKILQCIKKSGYPFEQIVASCLEEVKWYPTLNYAFTDFETTVSREIDVLAEKHIWIESLSKQQNQPLVRLNAELLIECKQTKSPLVFFCRPKQISDFFCTPNNEIVQYSGIKSEVVVKPRNERDTYSFTASQFLRFGKLSHYSKSKEKATQFCKIYWKGKDLRADHAEVYQSFIVPLIKAVAYQKMLRRPKPTWRYFDMYLHYPIMIVKGDIFKVDSECKSIEGVNHVELVRNYYSAKIGGTYHIDVVSESYFRKFVDDVLMPSIKTMEKEVRKRDKALAKGEMRVRSIDKLYHTLT